MVQVGAQIAPPAMTYQIVYTFSNYTTNCEASGWGNATWYQGTVVPPSSFVAGTAGIDP